MFLLCLSNQEDIQTPIRKAEQDGVQVNEHKQTT